MTLNLADTSIPHLTLETSIIDSGFLIISARMKVVLKQPGLSDNNINTQLSFAKKKSHLFPKIVQNGVNFTREPSINFQKVIKVYNLVQYINHAVESWLLDLLSQLC